MLLAGGRADEPGCGRRRPLSAVRPASPKVHTRIVSRSAKKEMADIGRADEPAGRRRLCLAHRALIELADHAMQLGNARPDHAPGAAAIDAVELDLALLHGL